MGRCWVLGARCWVLGAGAGAGCTEIGRHFARRHTSCLSDTFMARTIEELHVWRLADELRLAVHALTATEAVARDRRFCDQIRDAASSATRNISEGFGR